MASRKDFRYNHSHNQSLTELEMFKANTMLRRRLNFVLGMWQKCLRLYLTYIPLLPGIHTSLLRCKSLTTIEEGWQPARALALIRVTSLRQDSFTTIFFHLNRII